VTRHREVRLVRRLMGIGRRKVAWLWQRSLLVTSPLSARDSEFAARALTQTDDASGLPTLMAMLKPSVVAIVRSEAAQRTAPIRSLPQESCHLSCSGTHCYSRLRSILRSPFLLRAARPCSHSWMPDGSDARCTSSSSVRIGYRETSCRIWSWSSHSCYTQWGFDRPIWVLFRRWGEGLLDCSRLDRGLCSAAAANP
jgi:hypothetical protein